MVKVVKVVKALSGINLFISLIKKAFRTEFLEIHAQIRYYWIHILNTILTLLGLASSETCLQMAHTIMHEVDL